MVMNENNHYVVLGDIDDQYIRLIDLANNRLFYRLNISQLSYEWKNGFALVISPDPLDLNSIAQEISDEQTLNVIGYGGYTCTNLLREYNVDYCPEPFMGECDGTYREYFLRYGCEAAQSGSCSPYILVRFRESPCIIDPKDAYSCILSGEWTSYYMIACNQW